MRVSEYDVEVPLLLNPGSASDASDKDIYLHFGLILWAKSQYNYALDFSSPE